LYPAQVKQAKSLVEQSGIPFSAAVHVVIGKATLNEVLQELLREEKIKKLVETYKIDRALATNVALGRADLDIVLLRQRKNRTLQEHYDRCCLREALEDKHTIALAVHGFKKIVGEVVSLDKYTFEFLKTGEEARSSLIVFRGALES
jgi:hypothetical protein